MATHRRDPITDPPRRRMTYEEFLASADEDARAEWVDGEMIKCATQGRRYVRLISVLRQLVGGFVDLRRMGEVYGPGVGLWTRP